MADKTNAEEFLKPFHQRASEAEARLERLEAAIANGGTSSGDEGLSVKVNELTLELQNVKAQQTAEMQEARKDLERLTVQHAKLQYRITHLVKAVKDAESKIPSE